MRGVLEESIDITGHETKGKESKQKESGFLLMKAKLRAVLLVYVLFSRNSVRLNILLG